MYKLYFTKQAQKDAKKIGQSEHKKKVEYLLSILEHDPWINVPPYEKLIGNLQGTCSRRINIQHRLVYQIFEEEKAIKIIRMWTHYE